MKIAFFTDTFHPAVNGVVTALSGLAAELGKEGHEVAVFSPKPSRDQVVEWHAPDVNLYPITSLPALIYPDVRIGAMTPRSFLRLRKFRPDVIHVMTPAFVGIEGVVGGNLLSVPVVGTFHTYFMEPEYLRILRMERFGTVSKALWAYSVGFYNRCERVVVLSGGAADQLRANGLKRQIDIIPNGIELKSIQKKVVGTGKECKARYRLGSNVLLYVGRLSKEKDLEVLIEAFALVEKRMPTVQLLIVGGGPMFDDLHQLVVSKGLSGKVIFTGTIPSQELLQSGVHESASLFCTASTSEVQPMSVIEAMAVGLPIVGVRAKGMIDLVKDNGALVTPGDAEGLSMEMEKFLKDPKLREKAGQESVKMAARHAVRKVAKEHEKVYSRLIS